MAGCFGQALKGGHALIGRFNATPVNLLSRKLAITKTEISVNKNKAQKAEVVADRKGVLEQAECIVLAKNTGMNAAQASEVRSLFRAQGVDFKVSKNRLVIRALQGTRFEGISHMLKGPIGIASSKDPVAAAKVAATFAKTNEAFVIIGGALGEKVLDKSGVEALSKLPSLDEMRSTLLAMFQTPATRLAVLTAAPAAQLARVTRAYADKG
jgi:large subunit ribosomal protein L10